MEELLGEEAEAILDEEEVWEEDHPGGLEVGVESGDKRDVKYITLDSCMNIRILDGPMREENHYINKVVM